MVPVGREFGSAEFDELERQAEAQGSGPDSEATVCFVKLLIRAAARIMEKWKPKNGFHFPTIPAATAVSRFRNKLRSDAVGGFRVLSH